jgi:EAL domain-containing protein (putative c-di-GMP-specific phosphodiesterase class I)/FixJ family two-component response regulator
MASGRLLILDDDRAIGQTMQLIAESERMEVRFTTQPGEFFEAVIAWQPTHISIDLAMPEMDGVQVLGQLAACDCRAGIIIASGVGARVLDAARRSAAGHGLHIIGVLAKPFSTGALRALLADTTTTAPVPVASKPAAPPQATARAPFQATIAELQRALDRHELQLVYQPKVSCADGALAGFEALVRWMHPEHGLIMPDRFVPFAEANGLIDALTERVVELVLTWFGQFIASSGQVSAATGQPPDTAVAVSLSMNISARMPKDLLFVERILERCNQLGIDPARLTFELTETSAMEDAVKSLDVLTRMRVKGFQLSLDDFGTGYSSMVQLVRLPFSEIKVDKSFVMTAMQSQESRNVVKSIVQLGHSLGLYVTAEGVESAETLEYLKLIGCDLAQGYYIASPMPAEHIAEWIRARWP